MFHIKPLNLITSKSYNICKPISSNSFNDIYKTPLYDCEMKEEIGRRIKELLDIKNGGNQSALAKHVGVSPQAVQQWVAGETSPKGKNLEKAAEFLNATKSYISYGDQETGNGGHFEDKTEELSQLLNMDIRTFSSEKINMLRQAAQVPEERVGDTKSILNVFTSKQSNKPEKGKETK